MAKKTVLIIDEDSQRAEKIDFIVRLGGYKTRSFASESAAINWMKYGCEDGAVLCLLFNNPGEFDRVEHVFETGIASGKVIAVLLVNRGRYSLGSLHAFGKNERVFTCEPEGVMQSLDILSAIEYSEAGIVSLPQNSFADRG